MRTATASDPGLTHAPHRGRRGPPTGVFRRFEALVERTEEVASKRKSSTPPEAPAPRPMMRTLPWGSTDGEGIEEVSCVEAPPSVR